MILSKYFKKFLLNNQSSGTILLFFVILSLIIANTSLSVGFQNFLNIKIGLESLKLDLTISHWINDFLMAVFFLLVGLVCCYNLLVLFQILIL